jgi:hypothetical protein
MTDTTHEAPERIWAGKYRGTWWQSRPHHQMTEYVRADLVKERSDEVQAAVAAALKEAINRVNGCDRVSEVQPAELSPRAQ